MGPSIGLDPSAGSGYKETGKTMTRKFYNSASRFFLLSLWLLMGLLFLGGCSFWKPAQPADWPEPRQIAVLPLEAPDDFGSEDFILEGFWFWGKKKYENPRAGNLTAELLTPELRKLPYLQVLDFRDVQRYLAQKVERLQLAFPNYEDEAYTEMLQMVSPADYGKELGVAYVLTGRLEHAHTTYWTFLKLWHSRVRLKLDLWEVASGEVVWSHSFGKTRMGLSFYAMMQDLAPGLIRKMDRKYFKTLEKEN